MTTNKNIDFAHVWSDAFSTAWDAGMRVEPEPMVVTATTACGTADYHVSDGVCGFAWIEFKGNTRFAKWARDAGLSYNAYPTGHMISCRHFGQSMQRKEAWAYAMARQLKLHGIEVRPCSRLD